MSELKDMIAAIIRDVVRESMTELNVDTIAERAETETVSRKRALRERDSEPEPVKRTRRVLRPTVVYLMTAAGHKAGSDVNANAGTLDVWKAIRTLTGRKAEHAMTEKDIIAAVGRKDASAQNAAQSAIWWLRNHNADGKRVAPNSRGALLVSVRNEDEQ